MTEERLISVWNKSFQPGQKVEASIPTVVTGRTITPARIIDGKAAVYVDNLCGPVPLSWVRPLGKD